MRRQGQRKAAGPLSEYGGDAGTATSDDNRGKAGRPGPVAARQDYDAMRWEYRVDKMPIRSGGFVGNGMNVDAVNAEFLNAQGAQGWELVSAMPLFVPQNPTDCFVYYYWKRRAEE